MYIAQCNHCPHRQGCEIRLAKLKAVRGAGLTSMRFKCDKRLSELQPGQRIVTEPVWPRSCRHSHGTVMRPIGNRVLVWLDTALAGKRLGAFQPDHLTPTDGERVRACVNCGQLEGTESRAGFDCGDRNGSDCEYVNGSPR